MFVVVTFLNGRSWWRGVQDQIRSRPDLEPGYRRLYRGYLFWMNLPWLAMGLGIVSGQVSSMFDYLRPSSGDPAVLAWWGFVASLLCVGTWWILAGGGAEFLERYPGMHMVPRWPASRLRLFWLGVVVWNVVIGSLLFFGFPWGLNGRQPSGLDSWLPSLFPVFFVGMWVLVSFLLSVMGGWGSLAGHYRATAPFAGKHFRFRSAQLGGYANYGGVLTLGASSEGLYLAVLPPFRIGHPPLLVPWSDVTAREVRSWFSTAVVLEFAKDPGASVRLTPSLARALIDASGNRVTVHPAVK